MDGTRGPAHDRWVEPLKRIPSKASSAASSICYPGWHRAALPDRQIDFLNHTGANAPVLPLPKPMAAGAAPRIAAW